MKKSLSKRITAYFLIIMVLMIAVSVTWNYFSTRRSIIETEKSQAEGCSRAIRTLMAHYGEDLDEARDSENYLFLRNAVSNYRMGFNQDAIYLYKYETGTGTMRMLLEVSRGAQGGENPDDDLSALEIQGVGMGEAEQALYAGSEQLRRFEWTAETGRRATWIALLTEPGAPDPLFLSMEYSVGLEDGHILSDFLADVLMPNIALGIAFLVMILMIRRRVAAPIRVVSDRMKRFAHNSRELPEPLAIRSADEIGEIASSFEGMTKEITASIDSVERLTRERAELHVQMDVARRIQYGLVPERTALNSEAFRVRAMTRPAKAVGGDFYDCFSMDDSRVCVLMGDVSGKGITGAIFMAMIRTMIREKLMLGLSPAQALNRTNEQLLAQNPEGLFATVFAAILDPCTGEMRYANAGHTWPVLLGGEVRVLEPETGIALGLFDDADIVDESMPLAPGEGILLYTDGLTDALNAERIPFGMDRLLDTLRAVPPSPDPAEAVLAGVSGAVSAYSEGVEPFDDTALLVLFRTAEPSGGDPLPLPVALSSFAAIREAVFARTGDTPAARQALLACDEVLANIVRYSGAARLSFACGRHGDALRVVFTDDGIPFDPTAATAEEKPFEELDAGGMGLNLIRQLAASAHYVRADGQNVFTLDFPCDPQP